MRPYGHLTCPANFIQLCVVTKSRYFQQNLVTHSYIKANILLVSKLPRLIFVYIDSFKNTIPSLIHDSWTHTFYFDSWCCWGPLPTPSLLPFWIFVSFLRKETDMVENQFPRLHFPDCINQDLELFEMSIRRHMQEKDNKYQGKFDTKILFCYRMCLEVFSLCCFLVQNVTLYVSKTAQTAAIPHITFIRWNKN